MKEKERLLIVDSLSITDKVYFLLMTANLFQKLLK